ncbi:TnsA endonuclease N-terminal domain-containing protein [Bradyrhizobium lablabi]|uniref:TnsA endonuclease N-terminal domain-containing protein n=1 Tax=Bradyrhizobium lablabi TaxID=722472 RepID=UPI001BA4502F|nr:TnsA endonuclease N-terminal domain-containing protein [Bradyrhizobium lablabi]MBR0695333.1 TnsA endonuclease N-terminal domain-containing protein [Bradyrhizobium lablabi]
MARSRYDWTEKRIKRFLKEGRGKGHGASYKPWLIVSDVPSHGRTHRVFFARTGRQHHFLSDIEYYAFLHSTFDDTVIDIREQFPLDRPETLAIAAALGVKHPGYKGVPIVMTTDLVETRAGAGFQFERAIAIKPDDELDKTRIIEKLEIERVYWSRRGIPWFIRSESSLRTTKSFNLEWMFDTTGPGDIDPAVETAVSTNLAGALALHQDHLLGEMCVWLDRSLGLEIGNSLQIVRRLLCKKHLLVDLAKPVLSEQPCRYFSINLASS